MKEWTLDPSVLFYLPEVSRPKIDYYGDSGIFTEEKPWRGLRWVPIWDIWERFLQLSKIHRVTNHGGITSDDDWRYEWCQLEADRIAGKRVKSTYVFSVMSSPLPMKTPTTRIRSSRRDACLR